MCTKVTVVKEALEDCDTQRAYLWEYKEHDIFVAEAVMHLTNAMEALEYVLEQEKKSCPSTST